MSSKGSKNNWHLYLYSLFKMLFQNNFEDVFVLQTGQVENCDRQIFVVSVVGRFIIFFEMLLEN